MADNIAITAGSGTTVSTEEITTLNGGAVSAQHLQRIAVAVRTGDGAARDIDLGSGTGGSATPRVILDSSQLAAARTTAGAMSDGYQLVAFPTDAPGVGAEDQASGDGHTGFRMLATRKATPANTSGTDGDYEFLQMANGALWVSPLGFQVTCSTDITRPADTAPYTANDAWSDSTTAPTSGGFTFTGAGRKSGGSGVITDAIITTSNDAGTLLQGEIWIFDTSVTNINDNAAFAVSDTEIKSYVGKIAFTLEDAGNNGSYHAANLNYGFTCVGSANLRFLVKVKNAYTPASGEVLTVRLKIIQTD